ncbi:MAG TPA: hypothetical protein VL119_01795 [Acidimicrobiia bacterium]|nr:hypothetical protein [Acidimicrobiia bacterium]
MVERLNVLVVESDAGAAAPARAELENAGHRVQECRDPHGAAFPCNALVDGRGCPFDGSPLDVVLDVRSGVRSQPSAREDGVVCALRQYVPVVIAGSSVLNPYEGFATEILDGNADLVAACERAACAPLEAHSRAAELALHGDLARRSADAGVHATVRRRRGSLLITVSHTGPLDRATRNMIAVRMRAAVRELDRFARGIDVVFDAADSSRRVATT